MKRKRCVRCQYEEFEHDTATRAECRAGGQPQPCHDFEPKAPLWLKIYNRIVRSLP